MQPLVNHRIEYSDNLAYFTILKSAYKCITVFAAGGFVCLLEQNDKTLGGKIKAEAVLSIAVTLQPSRVQVRSN